MRREWLDDDEIRLIAEGLGCFCAAVAVCLVDDRSDATEEEVLDRLCGPDPPSADAEGRPAASDMRAYVASIARRALRMIEAAGD